MGKVYEFSEVLTKRIPRPDDFATAKIFLLKYLDSMAKEGQIYGAKVFGSVGKGTPNVRSDFDLLVVTENDNENTFLNLKKIFRKINNFTNVDIEPIVINKDFAKQGVHTIDEFFIKHIGNVENNGNVAGHDPLEVLKPVKLSPSKILEQYLSQKLRRLEEGVFIHSYTDKYRVLQRTLEAPISVGRKTLQILPSLGFGFELKDDSKKKVLETFDQVFASDCEVIKGFQYLVSKDVGYTDYLNEALKGGVPIRDYESAIEILGNECLPQAINWTRKITQKYLGILEGNHNSRENIRLIRKEAE